MYNPTDAELNRARNRHSRKLAAYTRLPLHRLSQKHFSPNNCDYGTNTVYEYMGPPKHNM